MDINNSTLSLYLQEDISLKSILFSIREEIFSAIRTAQVNHAFNKDVELSFGKVHINEFGSVSPISFNGVDVVDVDRFVVEQAFHVRNENYFDIRNEVRDNVSNFSFYPITDGKRVTFTLLKYSKYFEDKYGNLIKDHNSFKIRYTLKYILIEIKNGDSWENHVYCIDLYDSFHFSKLLLSSAGKTSGMNNTMYFCFSNTRPEELVRVGLEKKDFKAYGTGYSSLGFKFYKGTVSCCIMRIYKVLDEKGKILVKDSLRKFVSIIADINYGGLSGFCNLHEIDESSLRKFIFQKGESIRYSNGNSLTQTKLEELLNLPITISAYNLKNNELLEEIEYKDIPERGYYV